MARKKGKPFRWFERDPNHYSIDQVLSKVRLDLDKKEGRRDPVMFGENPVNMASDRYKCFYIKGVKCAECGIEGKFFALERDTRQPKYPDIWWHFNLYAIDSTGREVLMTKDHILPIAKGGKDEVANYQTLCAHCNEKKGCQIYH